MRPMLYRLLSLTFASLLLCVPSWSAEPTVDGLQGFWFGDGAHSLNNKVLLIQDDGFIVISPLGRFESTFAMGSTSDGLTEIDIQRFDGKRQLGLMKVGKAELFLKLAAPGDPRPTKKDVTYPSGKPHWHTVFNRRPTRDGLVVLQRDLQNELGLNDDTTLTTTKN